MNDLQVHLIHADMLTISEQWDARDVCSTFWRLYINQGDGAGVWWQGGMYPLPGERLHLIPAYVKFSCVNRVTVKHLFVHFDLLGVTPVLQKRIFPAPLSLPLSGDGRRLWEL